MASGLNGGIMTFSTTTISGLPNEPTPLSGAERVPMDDLEAGTTRDASTQDIANLAPGTNLTYDQQTRTLASSTGSDAVLPLATDTLDGLASAAHRALIQGLIDAGLTVSGNVVTIPHIHGDIAGSLYVHVKNTSGATLAKGTPVRSVGQVGDTTTVEVAGADAASPTTLPAFGMLADTIAPNGTGHAVVAGELAGLSTSGYTLGQILYVAAGGGVTGVRPATGTIQQIAIVGRINANTGGVTVTVGSLQSPNWDTAVQPAALALKADLVNGVVPLSQIPVTGFIHLQSAPASTWTINHNLGYRPAVEILDSGGQEIEANVSHPTANQAVVQLNPATAGIARLS